MPQVILRPSAFDDLEIIWQYIAEENIARADAFLDTINTTFLRLAAAPQAGRSRPELFSDLLSFPVGRYLIFYFALQDGIEIVRVLHGARDIDNIFSLEE